MYEIHYFDIFVSLAFQYYAVHCMDNGCHSNSLQIIDSTRIVNYYDMYYVPKSLLL